METGWTVGWKGLLRLSSWCAYGMPLLLVLGTAAGWSQNSHQRSFAGVVKDETGKPVRGVFVQARNGKNKITTTVLTDQQGNYWFDPLPPGIYEFSTFAPGFSRDYRADVKLEAGESPSLDFSVKSQPIRWTELSWVDYRDLLPERPGKAEVMRTCGECHGVRWLSTRPMDLLGWESTIDWMRTDMASYIVGPDGVSQGNIPHLTDQGAKLIASYLASLFGPEAKLPRSPNIQRRDYYTDEALKIVFVDYDVLTGRAFPLAGYPDDKGNIWIPEFNANQIARLNPESGEIKEFKVPFPKRAAVHSAVPSPNGDGVWLTEASTAFRIAKFDPKTEKFTEYPDLRDGVKTKQTNVVDSNGNVWSSGSNVITRFDPKTGKFSYYGDKLLDGVSDGIATDQEGNVWFTRLGKNTIGKIDAKTGKVKEWNRPDGEGPRRIHVDSKGYVWFGQFYNSNVVRFDPKTETFKEYPLPGPEAKPYGLVTDANGNLWYYAWGRSEMGLLDPNTGKVTQYPIPYIDPTTRDLFKDSKDRIWYAAPNANKVGYFYLRNVD